MKYLYCPICGEAIEGGINALRWHMRLIKDEDGAHDDIVTDSDANQLIFRPEVVSPNYSPLGRLSAPKSEKKDFFKELE